MIILFSNGGKFIFVYFGFLLGILMLEWVIWRLYDVEIKNGILKLVNFGVDCIVFEWVLILVLNFFLDLIFWWELDIYYFEI